MRRTNFDRPSLRSDETILFRSKPRVSFYVGPFLLFIAALLLALMGETPLAALLFGLFLGATLLGFVSMAGSEFIATNRRIMARSGFMGRRFDAVEWNEIKEIKLFQGPWSRLLKFGTVAVHKHDGASKLYYRVSNPTLLKSVVPNQIDAA